MPDYRYQHLVRPDCPLPPGTHVIGYCRDSGGEEQDRSVGQQEEALREYCDMNSLVLEHIYVDRARTGSDSEKRSELNRLRADIALRFPQIRNMGKRKRYMAANPFGLLCWKSSRLGRDSLEATSNKADFRLRGLTIIPMVASIDTGDPALNAMIESIQQVQDEKLLEDISNDSRRGLSDIVTLRDTDRRFRSKNPDWQTHDGRYLSVHPGVPPMGFKGERILIDARERKGKRGGGEAHHVQRIVPDHEDDLWARCRLAWEMRHKGEPIKRIMQATRLFPTAGSYSTFFKNRIYTGTLVYGGHIIENFVEALIPMEWWEEEQAKRAKRRAKLEGQYTDPLHEPRRVASRHLLSGLVYCGAVEGEEHPMTADTVPAKKGTRARWDFYICTHRKNSREQRCQASRVGAAALDQSVIERLLEDVLTLDALRPAAEGLAASLSERNADLTIRIKAVQSDLNNVQKAIRQLVNAIEQHGYSSHIQTRLEAREAEERQLITQLVNLQETVVRPADLPKVGEAQLEEWIRKMRMLLNNGDIEDKRLALRTFVRRIVVHEKEGTIYYSFPLSHLARLQALTPTGLNSSPSYSTIRFQIARVQSHRTPALKQYAAELTKERARVMRADGLSYPMIAKLLGISVGCAWDYVNSQKRTP